MHGPAGLPGEDGTSGDGGPTGPTGPSVLPTSCQDGIVEVPPLGLPNAIGATVAVPFPVAMVGDPLNIRVLVDIELPSTTPDCQAAHVAVDSITPNGFLVTFSVEDIFETFIPIPDGTRIHWNACPNVVPRGAVLLNECPPPPECACPDLGGTIFETTFPDDAGFVAGSGGTPCTTGTPVVIGGGQAVLSALDVNCEAQANRATPAFDVRALDWCFCSRFKGDFPGSGAQDAPFPGVSVGLFNLANGFPPTNLRARVVADGTVFVDLMGIPNAVGFVVPGTFHTFQICHDAGADAVRFSLDGGAETVVPGIIPVGLVMMPRLRARADGNPTGPFAVLTATSYCISVGPPPPGSPLRAATMNQAASKRAR
jgi:hypothetical protein